MKENHYRHLGVMAALSFVAMYILMYAMVDSFDHVYMNISQFYMAGLMAAPMVLIELVVMRGMYHDKRLNSLIAAASVVVGVLMFVFIQRQAAVSGGQILRSMIPHHSGAILMCQNASLQDAEISELCKAIVSSQQQEIDQMTAKLRRLQ
jgi:hypothetical protein